MPMIYYEVKRAAFISGAIAENSEETSGFTRGNMLQDLLLITSLTLSSMTFWSLLNYIGFSLNKKFHPPPPANLNKIFLCYYIDSE